MTSNNNTTRIDYDALKDDIAEMITNRYKDMEPSELIAFIGYFLTSIMIGTVDAMHKMNPSFDKTEAAINLFHPVAETVKQTIKLTYEDEKLV